MGVLSLYGVVEALDPRPTRRDMSPGIYIGSTCIIGVGQDKKQREQ